MEQNLPLYRIFYEVARTENISRTSKELYISQPAISKSISKLESNLKTTLFTRNSRGVQLTEDGRMLYKHVQAAFDALARGEDEIRQNQELGIGQLRIGVSNTLCRYMLLPYLKGFISDHPHIKISIFSQSSSKSLDMLDQGQIDVGLVAEPRNKRLDFFPVRTIEDCFVATDSYLDNLRLREGNQEVDWFEKGNIMLLDHSNVTRLHIDNYLIEHHIECRQILEVTSMDLLIEFARIGMGIGCVIKDFVQEDLNQGLLTEIPLSPGIRPRTIGFVSKPSAGNSRAVTAFSEYYKSHHTPSDLS